MRGTLTNTPEREKFFVFLRKIGGLTDASANAYISYINNLCKNMAFHGTNGATQNNALDILINMAHDASYDDGLCRMLSKPIHGPKGRAQDLISAVKQFFHFIKSGHKPIPTIPPSQPSNSNFSYYFKKIYWLRKPPEEAKIKALDDIFGGFNLTSTEQLKGSVFDQHLRDQLAACGCTHVSEVDSQKVIPTNNYTFDLTATTSDGIRLLIEIEKTEVKRIIHDILKIAAGQKIDPYAIGLIIVPERYKTEKREFSRTHLQEAIAMMELLDYSHTWSGQSIGILEYCFEKNATSRSC